MSGRILARLALGLAMALPLTALAGQADQVSVGHPWIRVLPGTLPAGGYATLSNDGDAPAALVGASSPGYDHVMLHQSTVQGGVSRMHMIKQLAIPAHGKATLAPGGYHLMFMHPKATVTPGQTVKVTLRFADGSQRDVDFLARPANAVDDSH